MTRAARSLRWTCRALGALLLSSSLWACQPAPRDSDTEGSAGPSPSRQVSKAEDPLRQGSQEEQPGSHGSNGRTESADPQEARYASLRSRMVEQQLCSRDITDSLVLAAMARVPRHRFVPEVHRAMSYSDTPLPIGHNQTISQPYIVALMTQLALPRPGARALDIGTGSGYQAAVLAELVGQVYGIEIICPLAEQAKARLERLGYTNVEVRCGDGYRGWPQQAPFDIIILAAAPDHIPEPLVEQLAPGGRLVLPVGRFFQDLLVVEKEEDGTTRQWRAIPVRFVPMTGEAEKRGAGDK